LLAGTKTTIAFAAICLALSIVLFSIRAVSIPVAFAGLAIVWLSLLPTFLYLRDGNYSSIPFMPMVGAFYLLFFGISVFVFQFNGGAPIPEAYDTPLVVRIRAEPLLLVAAGLAAQIIVFVFARRVFERALPDLRIVTHCDPRNLALLAWVLVAVHLVYKYVPQIEKLPSVAQFLEPAGYVGFVTLLLLWFRGALRRSEAIMLFVIALPLAFYVRVRTIFLTQILFFGLAAIFTLWKARKFRMLAAIVLLSLVVLTGYGATAGVRDPLASRFANFYNVASAYVNAVILGKPSMMDINGNFVPFKGRFDSLIQRTAHVWIFHRVYDWTPRDVPYWDGATYLPLLTSMIPRVLYPDKPEERSGLEFGVTYELIGPQSVTSVNIPWITELLMNFGPIGVIGGMAFFGMLLALLDRVFNSRAIGIAEFAVGLPILIKFVYPESNFSVTVGSTPLLFISLFLYFRIGLRLLEKFLGAPHPIDNKNHP
jgi:hypothetical protein